MPLLDLWQYLCSGKSETKLLQSISDHFTIALEQACQTGGPRAACGPIACPMRPEVIFYKQKLLKTIII